MTALMASFSIVASPPRGGMAPRLSWGSRPTCPALEEQLDGVFVVVDGDPLRHQVHASSPSVGRPYARAAYHQLAESDLTASLFRTILGRIHT